MTLLDIALLTAAALTYGLFLPARWRALVLFVGSVLAVYWLQPALPVRYLDFLLPTATLLLAVAGWWWTRLPAESLPETDRAAFNHENRLTLGITFALILAVSATRYLAPELRLTSRPPEPLAVALVLLLIAGFAWGSARLWWQMRGPQAALTPVLLALIGLFIALKAEPLAAGLSAVLRAWQGQDVTLAAGADLGWLGFSYVAFRLIHTLRDRQSGKLPALTLREYLTYIIFFPALTAGPIDRAERFVPDYRAAHTLKGMDAARWAAGGGRILVGLFKKFVIADTLALLALDAARAEQALTAGGLWLLLYAYGLRLYFDFAGYSDIAIGIGLLFGVRLPENFAAPYLRNNLARFWQSWHITLSSWARFYVFSPLSRWLLKRPRKPPQNIIVLTAHGATMLVIGLWHGFTLAFVLWGLWHAGGLFIHKLWSDRTRRWYISLKDKPRTKQAWTLAGVLLTFHFVTLGWVWFALPDAALAAQTFARLFGLGW